MASGLFRFLASRHLQSGDTEAPKRRCLKIKPSITLPGLTGQDLASLDRDAIKAGPTLPFGCRSGLETPRKDDLACWVRNLRDHCARAIIKAVGLAIFTT